MFVYHTKVDGAGYPKKAYGTKYFQKYASLESEKNGFFNDNTFEFVNYKMCFTE